MAKNKEGVIVWKHTDGRYLTTRYMGDGDYEVILSKELTQDAIVPADWPLAEILESCDGIYDDDENPIVPEPGVEDFISKPVKIEIPE